MKRKLTFVFGLLFALTGSVFAQFSADKTYVISNRNDTNLFMQDNGGNSVALGGMNNNSYWIFEATANPNCYYVKNATTGKYMQSCNTSEVEVVMGNTPVEYSIILCTEEGDGMYGMASTDQTTYDFTSGTIGCNWKNNNTVQGFAAVSGTNHRSFWKIEEKAMPEPEPVVVPLFEADKTYTIECNNQAGKFMQDNGDGYIVPASKNNNSYWLFEATDNEGCFYVKNAKTGKYMQKTSEYEVSVKTGDTPVEIYIKNDAAKGENVFGLASTDRNPHDFANDDTYGANYTDNYVQGFSAALGERPNSFWKIVEEAMPTPITGLTSPYEGSAAGVGTFYLYNVKTGKWMGDNHINTDGTWTSHGELGPRGRDIDLKAGNADGRFILDPKLNNNHSINGSNLYMDTKDGVTNWIFTPVDVEGLTNCYALTTPGGKAMGAKTDGWATSNADDIAENGNIWQLVSREERLAAMRVGDDCSWLVLGGTFPVADSHRDESAHKVWNGDYGDNNCGGDGYYHCNRVWEFWNITDRDIYQDITVPNGKFKFKAQAIYVSTGGGDMNIDRYNEYKADPEGNTKGVVYANDATTPMINAYSLVTDEKVDNKNTKEIASDVWAYNGTNEFSTNIFEGKGWTDEVEVEVTNGKLRVGAKVEGGNGAWMLIDNFTLTYAGEVVIEDLTPYIEALEAMIGEAEQFSGETTDALAAALTAAISDAQSVSRTDADAMTNATNALEAALNMAKTVDVKALKATVALAQTEGITVPTSVTDFIANGTSNDVESNIRLVRNLRKLNAIEKVDISLIECSEPANEDADYYLYNVGAGVFLSTTADWGTHIAIDNPGMLIHFRPDGEWNGAPGRPVFHLSGNGWDGMNWQEEYWDKNGENKLAFVPVEGKEKVYYFCEWDNYNWHFVYDPAEDVCDQNTHYWNAVQKRDWNVDDYKDNPYAQWMLISPEAYKAAMEKATEEKPLDVTYLINNPNFTKARVDGSDNWDRGWENVGTQKRAEGDNRQPWMVIEWYQADANMTQTIEGLAPGKYTVSCYGFYRDGSSDNEAAKVKNGETLIQNAFLFANDQEVALPNVTSEAGNMPGIGETRDGVEEFACWPWQANEYFQTGLYKATTPVVEVGLDGKLTIGVKSTYNDVPGSWIVVGNFRLTSLGAKKTVTIDEDVDFTAEDANDVVIVLNRSFVGNDTWNTFCVPFDISNDDLKAAFGDDVQVAEFSETADGTNSAVSFNTMKEPAITANEPVLVKSNTKETSFTFAGNVKAGEAKVAGTNFDFVGTSVAETNIAAGDYFMNENKLYKSEGETTIAGTRAYLKAKVAGARVASLSFDDNTTTAIEGIEKAGKSADTLYNLNGQRVIVPNKGLYIVNGKKMVVK